MYVYIYVLKPLKYPILTLRTRIWHKIRLLLKGEKICILNIKNRLMFDIYIYTSALRLLALRGYRSLFVGQRRPAGAWDNID